MTLTNIFSLYPYISPVSYDYLFTEIDTESQRGYVTWQTVTGKSELHLEFQRNLKWQNGISLNKLKKSLKLRFILT